MIGADIAAALPELRAQAESRMSETVQFFTEDDGIDDDTLQPVKVETPVGAPVRGRLRRGGSQAQDVPIAGQEPVVSGWTLSVPVGSVGATPSCFVRVIASDSDAGLAGLRFRVQDFPDLGQVTAWRYPVERVS